MEIDSLDRQPNSATAENSERKLKTFFKVKGFLRFSAKKFDAFCKKEGIFADPVLRRAAREHYCGQKHNPTLFELLLIDAYWHTGAIAETARLGRLSLSSSNSQIHAALELYHKLRKNSTAGRPVSLDDLNKVYAERYDAAEIKDAKNPLKKDAGTMQTGVVLNRFNVLSETFGVPLGFSVLRAQPLPIRKNCRVMLFSPRNESPDGQSAVQFAAELKSYAGAVRFECGLLQTMLRLDTGCVLDFEKLVGEADPFSALLTPSGRHRIVAIVPDKYAETAAICAAKYSFEFETVGKTVLKKRIALIAAGQTVFEADIGFLKGETLFIYADLNAENTIRTSDAPAQKHLTKHALLNVFAETGASKIPETDFAGVGRIAYAPYGGKLRLTPAKVLASLADIGNKVIVTSQQSYCGKISNPFLAAVYSVIVAIEKLVVSGVSLDAVKVSDATPPLVSEPERGNEFLYRLGILYAKNAFFAGVFVNDGEEPPASGFKTVCAGGVSEYSRLISNVFRGGQKIFRFPLKRDSNGMPDFKYLLKLFNAFSINISTGNIVCASVVEDNPLAEVLRSCLGNYCGFSFATADSGIQNNSFGDLIAGVTDISEFSIVESEYLGITDTTGVIKNADIEVSLKDILKASGRGFSEYRSKQTLQAETEIARPCKVYTGVKKYAPSVFLPMFDRTSILIEKGFVSAGARVDPFSISPFDDTFIREARLRIENADILAFSASPSKAFDMRERITEFIRHPVILDSINELLFRRDGLILAFGEAFYSLIELGFLPFGRYVELTAPLYKLTRREDILTGKISRTKITSNGTPWLTGVPVGTVYSAVTASRETTVEIADGPLAKLFSSGQICSQYVDFEEKASMLYPFNPVQNTAAVESLCSPDGRIFGMAGHDYKVSRLVNIKEDYDLNLFLHGIEYFRS